VGRAAHVEDRHLLHYLAEVSWSGEISAEARVHDDKVSAWFALPAGEGLVVAYRVVADEGDIVPVELRLYAGRIERGQPLGEDPQPADPFNTDTPITRRLIHGLPVASHLRQIREEMNPEYAEEVGTSWAWLGFTAALLGSPARTSRRTIGENAYLAAAIFYAHAVATRSHAPVEKTRDQLATLGYDYSQSRVRALVQEARRRGFLTAATRGSAGGKLTPAASDARRRILGY
jgi:hypothetical protein